MAKDGTSRGGVRIGAGKKRDSLDKKIIEGLLPNEKFSPLQSKDMPPLKKYMMIKQRAGVELTVDEIYQDIWQWLKDRNCETLVDELLIEQYAMTTARWRQCETFISRKGLTGEHPTTGGEMTSVYVRMAQDYLKLASQLRYQIYQIVRENSSLECSVSSSGDTMEMLLKTKRQI